MNYQSTTITSKKTKIYNVLGKNYVRKNDAINALAKHEMLMKYFQYDDEYRLFDRDEKTGKMIPHWSLMREQQPDCWDDPKEFLNEDDYILAQECPTRSQMIVFNYDKWTQIKKQHAIQLRKDYEEL